MRSGQEWIAEYSESHRNRTNIIIHWVCVPAILWTVLAMLWQVPVPETVHFNVWCNWAVLLAVVALVFYVSFGFKMLLCLGLVLFAMLYSCYSLSMVLPSESFDVELWQLALGVFIVAWIGQFVGHKIEGKKPSFFKDILFLLVGPAWEANHFLRATKIVK